MPTQRSRAALLALCADNTTGDIGASDVQDIIESSYNREDDELADADHGHEIADVDGLQAALDALGPDGEDRLDFQVVWDPPWCPDLIDPESLASLGL